MLPNWHRVFFWVMAGAAILLALYLLISPGLAERFVFIPDSTDPGAPPVLAGIPGEDVELEASDGIQIHGWWWNAGADAPAVVFFHGNAGNISIRVHTARGLVERGVSVFLLSYRGYGRSQGRPSEEGVLLDGRRALDWVADEVGGAHRVVLHGRSLGGFVAAGVAAVTSSPVGGLILESTFTSLHAMAREVYPFIPSFLMSRLHGHFDTLSTVQSTQHPILVIHGGADRLIPPAMGESIHATAPNAQEFYRVSGAGHNDLPMVAGAEYFDRVASFVRQVAGTGAGAEGAGGGSMP
jgi:uncharacterized protein